MACTRLTIVYMVTIFEVVAFLTFLILYTQHWEISVYDLLFSGNKFISIGTAVFSLSNLTMTNTSMLLHGFISDTYRGVSNDVVLDLDNDFIRDMLRPSVTEKKYFSYANEKIEEVDCYALINGSKHELLKAEILMAFTFRKRNILTSTKHCLGFKLRGGYITEPLSKEEEEFPIAFSIVVTKDASQAEGLLRAIYRPQNVYCIHVDSKAEYVKMAMTSLVKCFDNVFLSSRSVSVERETITALEPDLICMEDLWEHKKWKYFINLSGHDFPLKTNIELVKILKSYNNTNDVSRSARNVNSSLLAEADSPPHNIIPVQGAGRVMVTRQFVDYVLHNQTARDLLYWVNQTLIPDKIYFATLNYNPQLGVPGSSTGIPETSFLARFGDISDSSPGNWSCTGKVEYEVCVFGIADLNILTSQPHAFAGKLDWKYQRYSVDCLKEWHYNRTRDEYLGEIGIDDPKNKHGTS